MSGTSNTSRLLAEAASLLRDFEQVTNSYSFLRSSANNGNTATAFAPDSSAAAQDAFRASSYLPASGTGLSASAKQSQTSTRQSGSQMIETKLSSAARQRTGSSHINDTTSARDHRHPETSRNAQTEAAADDKSDEFTAQHDSRGHESERAPSNKQRFNEHSYASFVSVSSKENKARNTSTSVVHHSPAKHNADPPLHRGHDRPKTVEKARDGVPEQSSMAKPSENATVQHHVEDGRASERRDVSHTKSKSRLGNTRHQAHQGVSPSSGAIELSQASMQHLHAAATKIQAAWRGFRARSLDPVCVCVRRELRTRRIEDHILAVYDEIDELKLQLEKQDEVRSLQHEAIRALWIENQSLKDRVSSLESDRRHRAATQIQTWWRCRSAQKKYSRQIQTRLQNHLSSAQRITLAIRKGDTATLADTVHHLLTKVSGLEDALSVLTRQHTTWGKVASRS